MRIEGFSQKGFCVGKKVNFIEHLEDRDVFDAEFGYDVVNRIHLDVTLGRIDIDNVQDAVRFFDLFECGLECLNQFHREFFDKSNRVGEEEIEAFW